MYTKVCHKVVFVVIENVINLKLFLQRYENRLQT